MNGKKTQIDAEVKKTLKLLDEIETIESNPYFYTRLYEKLKENTDVDAKGFSLRKLLQPAILLAIIFLNLITVAYIIQDDSSSTSNRSELISVFAREYSLDQDQYYIFSNYE